MADQGKKGGLGDDQGTRVGAPDRISPASHSDSPPDRPERTLGSGREATIGTDEEHDREHRSGYGGKGGAPDTPSEGRK
jgi:hypothetical protein